MTKRRRRSPGVLKAVECIEEISSALFFLCICKRNSKVQGRRCIFVVVVVVVGDVLWDVDDDDDGKEEEEEEDVEEETFLIFRVDSTALCGGASQGC